MSEIYALSAVVGVVNLETIPIRRGGDRSSVTVVRSQDGKPIGFVVRERGHEINRGFRAYADWTDVDGQGAGVGFVRVLHRETRSAAVAALLRYLRGRPVTP